MSATFKQYSDYLLQCLGTYQFIEEALRFCLVRCHATTQFRLDSFLTYKVPIQAIEDASLGRLIEWYKTYTKNTDLIRDLRAMKTVRDHVAHQGLALTLEEQTNENFLLEKITELKQAHARANECFKRLTGEMEATDEAVNRAYRLLQADYIARGEQAPTPFTDKIPEPSRNEP
ncbi:MAG: hypothetical protein ACYC1T_07255 [Sulfuricaulis sp.]